MTYPSDQEAFQRRAGLATVTPFIREAVAVLRADSREPCDVRRPGRREDLGGTREVSLEPARRLQRPVASRRRAHNLEGVHVATWQVHDAAGTHSRPLAVYKEAVLTFENEEQ